MWLLGIFATMVRFASNASFSIPIYFQLFFEVTTAILVITNALDRPYRQKVELIERLKRDGIVTFLVRFMATYRARIKFTWTTL